MYETDVIGNNSWTRGFLCEADVSLLEDFDSKMRSGNVPDCSALAGASTYDQLVEEDGAKLPTHCKHGIPVYEECWVCRVFLG